MKKRQKCTDNRCLYLIEDKNQSKKSFSTLTTKTREGKGLWEKCNICGLSINRTEFKKIFLKSIIIPLTKKIILYNLARYYHLSLTLRLEKLEQKK